MFEAFERNIVTTAVLQRCIAPLQIM